MIENYLRSPIFEPSTALPFKGELADNEYVFESNKGFSTLEVVILAPLVVSGFGQL